MSDQIHEQLAHDFVVEYLQRDIEFLDIVEFVDENNEDEETNDGAYGEVASRVKAILDTLLMRYEDEDK